MRTRNGRCPLPLVERFFAYSGDVFGFGGDVFHFEKYSSSVLGTSPVSDTPLEVGLWVSLAESVAGSNPALGSMMWCWVVRGGGGGAVRRGVTSHSVDNTIILSIVKDENPAG